MTAEDRQTMFENRLDFLEVQIDAMRGLVTGLLAIIERDQPGLAARCRDCASAVMIQIGNERSNALEGALDALVDDVEQLRGLPAND
ncbi:hypothetical protein D2V17_14380 [Aurantiacibacter xanthus]|uniref:Uncharacterized protein n=1 Tax=Aurantiacibacter xanthus TaxID=1784712 RepID=A0A3A1P3W9_9SPHN|nr:hypothetical protein [Aurantiacibacter xanthus]RIV82985.1 hypothetical protein D2V17_14380 [Aurantiacibacter xanthus]